MQAVNDNELPRTRAEAMAIGVTRYFTGLPCKHGHVDERYTNSGTCAECSRVKQREKYHANPDVARARVRNQYAANPETARERSRQYRKENPDAAKATTQQWRSKNKAKRNKIDRDGRKRRREVNPESEREYNRLWRASNPELAREYNKRYRTKRMKDAAFRLEGNVRQGVLKGIRKGSKSARKTFSILGYTVEELMAHLECQFQPGMTWDNYGRGGWHIDHRIPLAAHNYETPDDIYFKKAWALGNLQPMWEPDNIRKGARLSAPFQPSLAIALPTNDNSTKRRDAKQETL